MEVDATTVRDDRHSLRGLVNAYGVPVPLKELYRRNVVFGWKDAQGHWHSEEWERMKTDAEIAEYERRTEMSKQLWRDSHDGMAGECEAEHGR